MLGEEPATAIRSWIWLHLLVEVLVFHGLQREESVSVPYHSLFRLPLCLSSCVSGDLGPFVCFSAGQKRPTMKASMYAEHGWNASAVVQTNKGER